MKRTRKLTTPPVFISCATVVGREESEGPLGKFFDHTDQKGFFGRRTAELAEGEMYRLALNTALSKAGLDHTALELLISGDLQNQCLASNRGLSSFGAPFLGIYGACSTCTEALLILSEMLSAGSVTLGAAVTGSHNSTAERQFRSPLEYGAMRPPSAQWTATAAGAFILASPSHPLYSLGKVEITEYAVGRLIDSGCKDASNMGASMAFSAHDTLAAYFSEEGHSPTDHDMIITGDLGRVGHSLLSHLMDRECPGISSRLADCGLMLYDRKRQDVHSGGSGCGCSAAVLASYILPALCEGTLTDVLFLSTGALTSQSAIRQGSGIIGIAPLIRLRRKENAD